MAIKKRYLIDQSPLFKLPTKRKLSTLLRFDLKEFESLIDEKKYRVFKKDERDIQHPILDLNRVHKRLANLLSRIAVPNYVHSTRGRSHISNAKMHTGNVPLVKTDISKFYPSITFSSVNRLFRDLFKCPPDVAFLLTHICCYQGKHLPTGSSISGYVAYFSSKHIFDEIDRLAKSEQCTMTLFVDDITISGRNASKRLLNLTKTVIRQGGLKVKDKKSHCFAAPQPKTVTGVVIVGDNLRIPNKLRQKIWKYKTKLAETNDPHERIKLEASIRGRRQAARQIDPAFT